MPPWAALEWLRTGWTLRDDRDVGALGLGGNAGAHAGQPGADYQDIVLVDRH